MRRFALSSLRFLAAGFLSWIVASCVVGPDYVPPHAPAPPAWHATLQNGLTPARPDPQALAQWWRTLNDPVLSQLIAKASVNNHDLALAVARVREARARREIAAAAWYPTLDAKAADTRNRSSAASGLGTTRELYSAEIDAQWELDLFGATRRAVQAATADVQATTEQRHDVLVSLLAEVALNYIDTRTLQQRLDVAQRNLDMQSQTDAIAAWRMQAGLASALDAEQARATLEQTRAQLPNLRTSLAQSLNQLAVLLGEPPGAVDALMAKPAPLPVTPLALAVGVPADVLRQRPDVRRAERQLAAQTARLGAASAARYPNLSLLGSIGVEALSAGRLFSADARSASLGANLALPIFNAGRLRQNVEVQNALQVQALQTYQSAVLTALQDVENALVAYAQEQQRRDALRAATAAAQRAAELANNQYASGLIDFLSVLDAQRSVLSLQDQSAVSDGTVVANLIRLYKALGGGWTSSDTRTSVPNKALAVNPVPPPPEVTKQ